MTLAARPAGRSARARSRTRSRSAASTAASTRSARRRGRARPRAPAGTMPPDTTPSGAARAGRPWSRMAAPPAGPIDVRLRRPRRPAPATVTKTPRRSPSQRPGRQRLGDAGEGAGEVLVVAERDGAVERQDGQRRVVAGRVARLGIVAARRRRRVAGALHARAAGHQQGRELAGTHVAGRARCPCGRWRGRCPAPVGSRGAVHAVAERARPCCPSSSRWVT